LIGGDLLRLVQVCLGSFIQNCHQASGFGHGLTNLFRSFIFLVQAGDINRLVALFKNVLTKEIEGLGELRPLKLEEGSDVGDATEQIQQASSSSSTIQPTPKKNLSSTNSLYANSPNNATSPQTNFSPYAKITPSKRNHTESSTITINNTNNNINNSLSLLSKYILIASFLASSNPSKKDVLMLATLEDDLALSKRRKKGGAMRKSRTNNNGVNGTGGKNDELTGPVRKKDTLVPQRMLGPKPFPLERLIAITETILPVELRCLAKSQDILQEVSYCIIVAMCYCDTRIERGNSSISKQHLLLFFLCTDCLINKLTSSPKNNINDLIIYYISNLHILIIDIKFQ